MLKPTKLDTSFRIVSPRFEAIVFKVKRLGELTAAMLVLLLFALGLNALLFSGSLKKLYTETVISQYRELGGKIQTELIQGNNFAEITQTSQLPVQIKNRILHKIPDEQLINVSVIAADNLIQHSSDPQRAGSIFPQIPSQTGYSQDDDVFFIILLPIRSDLSYRIGITLGQTRINAILNTALKQTINIFIIIFCFCLAFIVIFNKLILFKFLNQAVSPPISFWLIFLPVVVSQLLFSVSCLIMFDTHFPGTDWERTAEQILFRFKVIGLDAATALIISIFFFYETFIMFSDFVEKRGFRQASSDIKIHYSAIRPVFFLLLFGLNISISFVPLYMEQLYAPILGFSKEVILSLPVSVSVFFTGIAFFIAGVWSDRRGWHEPFLAGSLMAGIGLVYAWLAPNALHFILSRMVSGIGYGLFFMGSQAFIITYTDHNSKARGFASLFAALYTAIICGSLTGSIIAEQMGYQHAFFIGALIIFSAICYAVCFMRSLFNKPDSHSLNPAVQGFYIKHVLSFLFDRNVLAVLLLSGIPASMAMIGFLEYFNPVYLSRLGTSQSNIGRTFLIYCLLIIYIGPLISKYMDASEHNKMFMAAGGLLGSMSFMTFYVVEGVSAVIIAIILLGISQSFVFLSQTVYLLKMRIIRQIGEGKAIAAFRLVNRLGQAAGPVFFGGLIAAVDLRQSIVYVGLAYLLLTLLLLLVVHSERKIAAAEN